MREQEQQVSHAAASAGREKEGFRPKNVDSHIYSLD